MSFAYDRYLPEGMVWRDLFDMVIIQARKPDFFSYNMSLYEVRGGRESQSVSQSVGQCAAHLLGWGPCPRCACWRPWG